MANQMSEHGQKKHMDGQALDKLTGLVNKMQETQAEVYLQLVLRGPIIERKLLLKKVAIVLH